MIDALPSSFPVSLSSYNVHQLQFALHCAPRDHVKHDPLVLDAYVASRLLSSADR